MENISVLNIPFTISEDQQDIVIDKSRFVKVEAAAGTGKTETIARKILYTILEEKIPPSSIVAFTFTEKAANEMKARVYEIATSLDIASLIDHLGEMFIGTIHAYCKRLLEDKFSYTDHSLFDENKEIAYLLRMGWSLGIDKYEKSYTQSIMEFHRTVNMVYSEMLDENKILNAAPEFYSALKKYEGYLDKDKIMTFGGIIHKAVKELRNDRENIQNLNLSCLFVDEFQDINPAQYELIKCLVLGNSRLMAVGDERQTIYQWRGSDHGIFSRMELDFVGMEKFYLIENRRSLPKIVDNANTFSKTLNGNYKDMTPTKSLEQPLILKAFQSEDDESKWIVDTIADLIREKKVKYSDIAILLRSVKSKGRKILDQFKNSDIPYQIGGKIGLFQREEGQLLGMIFTWLADKQWNSNGKLIEGEELLMQIREIAFKVFKLKNMDKVDLANIKNKAIEAIGKYRYNNITEIFQDILVQLNFKNLNPEVPKEAVTIANIGKFNNLLTDFETARRVGGKVIKWKSELISLYYFIVTYAHDAYEEAQPEVEDEMNAVKIMTVHQSKGLEWPFVIVAEMNRNDFPSSMTGRKMKWCNVPRELFNSKRYEGTEDDERRLFYVSLTRPKDELGITYIKEKESYFLEDLNKDSFGDVDLKATVWSENRTNNSKILEFTPSEIIWYHQCPYMYRLRNYWGFQPGLKEEIGFGNAMHSVLRNAVRLVKEEGINPVSAIKEASDRYFHLPFAGTSTTNRLKIKSEDILDSFIRKYPEFLLNAEEVEYRIIYKNGKIMISGRADVILSNGSESSVADYKTNRDVNTREEIEIQIGAYISGLRRNKSDIKIGKIAYLEEAEVDEINFDQRKTEEINLNIEHLITGIESKQFEPNVGEKCFNCDVRKLCRYGEYDE